MEKIDTPLKIIVEIYRMAGKPVINGVYLSLTINYSLALYELIKKLTLHSHYKKYIVPDEFTIDGVLVEIDNIPNTWNEVSITFQLPRDSIHRFHKTINELINFSSVRNGDFPSDFYILDLDYYADDVTKPAVIQKVESICRLIKSLAKLAHYHDKKSTDGEPRLVFILGSEGKSKAAILQPSITEEMLGFEDFDCSVVEQLQEEFSSEDVNHHLEKRGIFRNTLVEFINDNNYDFHQLVKHWTELRISYDNNLSVYLSGFNFHKARKEIASAELDFSEKTSKTISELTTKILAIPVSLLAALGVLKVKGNTEQLIVLTGVILTSIIIHLLIVSQKKQLTRINHAKDLVFTPFKNKLKKYPDELKKDIEMALDNLESGEIFSQRLLNAFFFLSWMPTLVGIAIIIIKNLPSE